MSDGVSKMTEYQLFMYYDTEGEKDKTNLFELIIHDFYSRKPMTLVMGGMSSKKIN
jgi:hypothetical protein